MAVMAMWGIACAMFGTLIAFALHKWAANWNFTTRVVVATIASTFPVLGIAAFALAALVGFPMSALSLSPTEFLIPFAVQIVLIVTFAIPATWLVSRRARNPRHPTGVFE
ncbi:MAG: hypothetical protein JF595_00235 [Sphingomonadales bacterium]|nr:hypothetical protein [Sphingomonadales bacterium]